MGSGRNSRNLDLSNALTTRNRISKVWENPTARRAIKSTIILVPATLFIVLQTPIRINTNIEGKAGLEIVIGKELVDTVEVSTVRTASQDIDKSTPIETWPAFPGAEGWGANATWGLKPTFRTVQASLLGFPISLKFAGKAGAILGAAAPNDSVCDRTNAKVHLVTNTNDSGSGSFRTLIDNFVKDTLQIVVFRTGGTINLGGHLLFKSGSCIRVAGQSAPGGGIQFVNNGPVLLTDRIFDGHLVVQYLRLRMEKTPEGSADTCGASGGRKHVWDHISCSFGSDEVWSHSSFPVGGDIDTLTRHTFQWNIIGPGLENKSAGGLISGVQAGTGPVDRATYHHVLWTHNAARNPLAQEYTLLIQIINTVVYNARSFIVGSDSIPQLDLIRNYWESGPFGALGNIAILHQCGSDQPDLPILYVEKNVVDDNGAGFSLDSTGNQKIARYRTTTCPGHPRLSLLSDAAYVGSRQALPPIPVTEENAHQARASVLAEVGASRKLSDTVCDGSLVNNRDALDSVLVNQVLNGDGASIQVEADDPADWGGIPTLAAGTACLDTDLDGMPDVWEDANGLDKNDGTDFTSDNDGDGYIALEEYLNGTTP